MDAKALTIIEEALPSGSLRARTTHIINIPVLTTFWAKFETEFMFLDTNGAEPSPKNVLICREVCFVRDPLYVVQEEPRGFFNAYSTLFE
jgi:hypothetical protein